MFRKVNKVKMTLKVKFPHKLTVFSHVNIARWRHALLYCKLAHFSPSRLTILLSFLLLTLLTLTLDLYKHSWPRHSFQNNTTFESYPKANPLNFSLKSSSRPISVFQSSALFPSSLSGLFPSPHFSCWTSACISLHSWILCQSWDSMSIR